MAQLRQFGDKSMGRRDCGWVQGELPPYVACEEANPCTNGHSIPGSAATKQLVGTTKATFTTST